MLYRTRGPTATMEPVKVVGMRHKMSSNVLGHRMFCNMMMARDMKGDKLTSNVMGHGMSRRVIGHRVSSNMTGFTAIMEH